MMASRVDDYVILVAIDFGTTYSGYAYTFKGDTSIFMNSNWTGKGQWNIVFKSFFLPKLHLSKVK